MERSTKTGVKILYLLQSFVQSLKHFKHEYIYLKQADRTLQFKVHASTVSPVPSPHRINRSKSAPRRIRGAPLRTQPLAETLHYLYLSDILSRRITVCILYSILSYITVLILDSYKHTARSRQCILLGFNLIQLQLDQH